jgi:hypothetical protein
MVLPFFSPLRLDFWTAGPEETKNPAGRKALRLIQIRLATPSLAKIRLASQDNSAQRGSPVSTLQAQCRLIAKMSAAKVTAALPLRVNGRTQLVSIVDMNMEPTNSMLFRASRFFSDRHAYRAQPGYLSELVAFGMIVFIAIWPIILLANAMAASVR